MKFSVFILLLVHLNFSIIPQFDEVDKVSKTGAKVDDINTVTEFVDQVLLGNHDSTPEDEDNDQARHLQTVKTVTYYCFQEVTTIKLPEIRLTDLATRYKTQEEKLNCIFFEIPSPPPKG